VPEGSILGPFFFYVFLNDLLLSQWESDLCNYADDNTLYASGITVFNVTSVLERDIQNIL